jgi:hypothetical protein
LKIKLKNDFFELNNSYIIQNKKCDLGGIPPLDLSEYDSICVTDINNVILITYKPILHDEDPSCMEKNIYNYYACWSNKKVSKYDYENTYEITNEDLGLVDQDID